MAHVVDDLSVEELQERFRSSAEAVETRHYQTI